MNGRITSNPSGSGVEGWWGLKNRWLAVTQNDTGFPSIVHFYDRHTVHQTLKRGDLVGGSGIESHFWREKKYWCGSKIQKKVLRFLFFFVRSICVKCTYLDNHRGNISTIYAV